jgi:hypothetical protein
MYLRTLCDRELYLSLFSNNPKELVAAGIPVPLKSRPGVQLITSSGIAFELEQYDVLINALPNNVTHADSGKTFINLKDALTAATKPTFILQPEFEPEKFRDVVLSNLGVAKSDAALIPVLSGLRPDIVFVDVKREIEHEIMPDGSRRRLLSDDDRTPLCIIDLKNVTEANASYSAEVCLYAIFLANWLHSLGGKLSKRFFVSARVYLWRHVDMPRFSKMKSTKEGLDHSKRLDALRHDLEDGRVEYLVYMPSVRKFFAEDLPRVISGGDKHGWSSVDYHVNPRCSSCDWLGNRAWLSDQDKKHFDAHPENYCSRSAEMSDHLSKMPMLSKGATSVLSLGGLSKVADVVGIKPDSDLLRRHSQLKKDRGQIGARADSITNNATSVDLSAKVGGLAKRPGAEYDIVVNFDPGSGLLTGIAVRGFLSAPFGQMFPAEPGGTPQSFRVLPESDYIINKDNVEAEWAALSAFIDRLGGWIQQTESLFVSCGFGSPRSQMCFWELVQYEELCNAFGRHLPRILDLAARHQRALAWIFPAEELMEKSDAICPNIVFIRDIVRAAIHLPQRFAVTILGTVEHYHHSSLLPRSIDNYYVEPLGNSIPRERIFEIWKSPTGTVQMFGRTVSVIEAITRYGNVLKAHAWALASITARLRADLKDCIEGSAPALSMSIPSGMANVAYDSKLWAQWSKVSAAVAATESLNSFIARPEWLEASYKAIILTKLLANLGGHRYEFEVSDDSTEAKIEEDDYCTLGIVDWPGFPLQKAVTLGLPVSDGSEYIPMYRVILARIEHFDRGAKRIIVRLGASWSGNSGAFDAVMASGLVPIGKSALYLLEAMPYDGSASVSTILRLIGNPASATPAPAALVALGASSKKKIAKGTDAESSASAVLWKADQLAKANVRTDSEAASLASFASKANEHPLNDSQLAAVNACAKHRLAVVWGPPGTGKTETLVAYLHAVVREKKQRKILITGPNYRAVEELAERLTHNLDKDAKAACDFFWLYSRNREPKPAPVTKGHLNLVVARRDLACDEYGELLESLGNGERTTIVATTAHIVDRLVEDKNGSPLAEVFDLVVLDESSQIPIALALKPIASLRADGQLIVAGDHKQMPPIEQLDPPKNAEYLVGSVQSYLIERFSVPQQTLLLNYRSNQHVVDFAKSLGYPAGLKAAQPLKDLHLLSPLQSAISKLPIDIPTTTAYAELLDPSRRVLALVHDDPISSQANEVEAGLVAGLAYVVRHTMARELYTGAAVSFSSFGDDDFFQEGIGIVTPHKAQKALVVRKLRALFPSVSTDLIFGAVDTVERFQGGERNTIIVSYGVGDTDIIEGEERFLLQLERTNVAISRAKAKCIVLMPKSLAYHLPTDKRAADTSIALKSYLDEFCLNRVAVTVQHGGVERRAEVRWH